MRKILAILMVLFAAYSSFAQPGPPPPTPTPYHPPSSVNRASAGNVVVDQRLRAAMNFYIPQYQDTSFAGIPAYLGQDSSGSIIYTWADDALWYRSAAKQWVRVGAGSSIPVLPDGVYSGGNVAWTGSGLTFAVSAASYVLGGTAYAYNGGTITLPSADPTFDRIDVIILDSSGANYIQGTPSASPQEPSINPQTQIRRALVTIPANSLTPAITSNIIFDENLGQPSEWDATSSGTVQFGDTQFPYHLTIAAATAGLANGETITFSSDSTYNSSQQGSLDVFIRLGQALINQNINVNLALNGVIVGNTLNFTSYGMIRSFINDYEAVIIPMPEFGAAPLLFNQIILTASGNLPAFNIDYLQFQNGFTLFTPQQNAFTSFTDPDGGILIANTPATNVNLTGSNGLFVAVDNNTKTIDFNAAGLIRNDLLYNSPQLAAISLSRYIKITNPDVENSILNVQGNQSSLNALATIQVNNGTASCCAWTDYSYTNPLSLVVPAASNHSSFGISIGKSFTTRYKTGWMLFLNDGDSASRNHIGIGFTGLDFIPFTFGADSSFKIMRPLGSDSTFKLDVGAKSRFLDAFQSGYLTAGARITDSTLLWKKAIDSLITASISGGSVTSVATNTGTGITGGTITTTGTLAIDTATKIATRAYVNNQIALNGTFYNSNVGSSFRLAIPFTNQIKTLTSGYSLTWDSATSNTLKISIDTTLMATRAYVGAAGGAGTVSAFSFSNANGFTGVVTNSTTTPQLTIATSVNGIAKGNGTALSAASSGTDYSAGTSGLATGILKSTTGTGALTIAVAADFPTLNQNTTGTASNVTGTVAVANGGTGRTTNTAYAVMVAGTTATGAMQQVSGVGTTGQVLTSNGAAALPTWQTPVVTSGVSSITGTANQVIASAATGAVTLSLPQSIATTSNVTFQRGTFSGAAATANLILSSHTDPTAAAGVLTNSGTRLAFSFATTYKRFALTNDVAPANGQIPIGNGTDYTVANITAGDNGTVITNGAGTIAIKSNSTPQTLTSGATITWNVANGENANLTLANTGATLNIQNPVAGHTYVIAITQGTGGSRTITTWPAGTVWPSGTAPILGTAVGARNLISLYYNGSNYFGAFNPNTYQ